MKKINATEFKKLTAKGGVGYGFSGQIKKLSVGSGLVVSKKEWDKKTDFRQLCLVASRNARKEIPTFAVVSKKLTDGSGYAVLRIS